MKILRLLAQIRCEWFSLRHDWHVRIEGTAITHTCKRCGKVNMRTRRDVSI